MFCERHSRGKLFSHTHTYTFVIVKEHCTVLILLVFSCTIGFTTCLLLNFSIDLHGFFLRQEFSFSMVHGDMSTMFVF
jgi:hypothetical protein